MFGTWVTEINGPMMAWETAPVLEASVSAVVDTMVLDPLCRTTVANLAPAKGCRILFEREVGWV